MSVYGGGLLEQYSIKISFDVIGKPKLLASEAMIVPFSKNEFWYMVPHQLGQVFQVLKQ